MAMTIYRVICIVPGCDYQSKWRALSPEGTYERRCQKCYAGITISQTMVGIIPNMEVRQINTLDEALLVTKNKIQFADPKSYRRAELEKDNHDRLQKIWDTAAQMGLSAKLFDALIYVGSYAHGARIVAVEDASREDRMSFEYVGLTKEGEEFIHIGAIYRSNDKDWSFHS